MTETMPIGVAWRRVRDRFRDAGIDTADIDARLLAQKAVLLDPMQLVSREREAAEQASLAKLEYFALARLAGQPVARLFGEREFWGMSFALNPSTLIPRPESEMLVAEGIAQLNKAKRPRILELGVGSGAIVVSLLHERQDASAIGVDLSEEALEGARANAERHQVAGRLRLQRSDWFAALDPAEKFDLIVSNPPYIATALIPKLQVEVREHDPILALDGGMDGLHAYRTILSQAAKWLKPGASLVLEIGATQAPLVSKMMGRAGFDRIGVLRDLQGLDRVVSGSHP
ncbi:MAG: peptide chain release factor N(5)-glutamine methyltransferase [Devosia sp.]